jgi:hypothetical protein
MIGHELAVEKPKAADPEPRDEPGEGDLRCVAESGEHAFAKEGGTESNPVEAAGQLTLPPAFDRMGVAAGVKDGVAFFYVGIDPGLLALGAMANDLREGGVARDGEDAGADRVPQRAGEVEAIERQDRPPLRLDPEHVGRVATVGHRKDADRIGPEERFGVDRRHVRPMRCRPETVNRLRLRRRRISGV